MNKISSLIVGLLMGTWGAAFGQALELQSFTNLNRNIPDGNWAGLSDRSASANSMMSSNVSNSRTVRPPRSRQRRIGPRVTGSE